MIKTLKRAGGCLYLEIEREKERRRKRRGGSVAGARRGSEHGG